MRRAQVEKVSREIDREASSRYESKAKRKSHGSVRRKGGGMEK